jgi:glycine cleavage system H protein
MFIGFVLMDLIVQTLQARRAAVPAPADLLWKVPQGFYLSKGHTWLHPDASVGVKVGADALVAHALGAVDKVVLPKLGEYMEAGQPLFHLIYQGCELKIASSITGRVVALNPGLGKRPELVTKDPYGSGWICAITPTESDAGWSGMRSSEKAAAWLEREFHRLREFLSLRISPDLAAGVTCQDGGLPALGLLTHLDRRLWSAFEAEFLHPPQRIPLRPQGLGA